MIEIDLQKLARGTKTEWRTVTRDGKTFKQRFRTGKKEKPELPGMVSETSVSGLMIPENIVKVTSMIDMGMDTGLNSMVADVVEFNGIKGIYKVINRNETFGETAFYDLSKMVGWDIVPESVSGDFGRGEGSCQRWIPDTESPKRTTGGTGMVVSPGYYGDLSKIFLMDAISGNKDRHSGNVVFREGKTFAIDNGIYAASLGYAKREIEGLDALSKTGPYKDEMPYMKIAEWLGVSMGDDKAKNFSLFRDAVYKNLGDIVKHKDKIMELYEKGPSYAKYEIVKDNLNYPTKIYEENL